MIPFQRGSLSLGDPDGQWAVLNALSLSDGGMDDSAEWNPICEQAFRPSFLDLEDAGYGVSPNLPVWITCQDVWSLQIGPAR